MSSPLQAPLEVALAHLKEGELSSSLWSIKRRCTASRQHAFVRWLSASLAGDTPAENPSSSLSSVEGANTTTADNDAEPFLLDEAAGGRGGMKGVMIFGSST